MFVVFDYKQLKHAPEKELHNGGWMAHSEVPARAEMILATQHDCAPAQDFGLDPILAIHDAGYVDFLQSAYARWLAAGRSGDAIGYTWPIVARGNRRLDRIDALLGRYSFDAATPIDPGTWEAAYASAQTALTAMQAILDGSEPHAFALCRPPGRHAGTDYLGGYCYLNNAAIAAQSAVAEGRRVAILDIDYHHGNGTQDIFWNRNDVFFGSIHADPATDYPFYWGQADDVGGESAVGGTLNVPLPRGTRIDAYLSALDQIMIAITRFVPDLLIVSFGADTFEADPISHFKIRTTDYGIIANAIAGLELPTLVVMEGGYSCEALGENVRTFLMGLTA